MTREAVLKIEGLQKRYPNGTLAVDNLFLTILRGEVFGILGPNGSGKTTTILMVLGLTEPTAGTISILGLDPLRSPLEVKKRVGYMPDTVGFYNDMTGFENLDYSARFLGLPAPERRRRIDESLEKMGIADVRDKKVRVYSHGMRQRLGLAEVLVKKPDIAVLDEPTQGLDPESASVFLDLIRSLKEHENITILLSSHLLNQVQEVCDRVGLFSGGSMAVSGSVDELSKRFLGGRYSVTLRGEGKGLEDALSAIEGVNEVCKAGRDTFRVECEKDVRSSLAAAVTEHGRLLELTMGGHSLDSIYKTYFQEVAHASG